ncbi:amidohydrolase family protein [Streptomyces sp. TBY4]|uniref:amidohydrolase family protein n=1 Tax=Streptomyces sp. TBY4 TaxID=2962030 RepID=UPI0020B7B63F|nr:amidohydrolase family protein [Streptomyces sp. TBY4]MCP3756987.1 amidohydrolase [Streptomyces sp. TBY4]
MTDDIGRVTAFWQDLGLPGLIDVHTHFMPEPVMTKVWQYFDAAGPLTGRPWPITYRMGEAERLARIRAFGVRAFTAMIYPHKPDMAHWLNSWAADFAARTPDCLHTATFYPEDGAATYVQQAVEAGARVFKAHLQVGDYDPNDPLLDSVWGLLQDTGTPVVIHCGSSPAPGRHTGPAPMDKLLERHPRLRLIIAHMGHPDYTAFLDLAARHPQIMLDTTMTFTDMAERDAPFPHHELPRLRDLQDRILLGTDYPNIPYPYAHALHALTRLDLGDDWLRAVCHDNAARTFAVHPPATRRHPTGPRPGR